MHTVVESKKPDKFHCRQYHGMSDTYLETIGLTSLGELVRYPPRC